MVIAWTLILCCCFGIFALFYYIYKPKKRPRLDTSSVIGNSSQTSAVTAFTTMEPAVSEVVGPSAPPPFPFVSQLKTLTPDDVKPSEALPSYDSLFATKQSIDTVEPALPPLPERHNQLPPLPHAIELPPLPPVEPKAPPPPDNPDNENTA